MKELNAKIRGENCTSLSLVKFNLKYNTFHIILDIILIYLCRKNGVNFNITQEILEEYELNFFLTLSECIIYEILKLSLASENHKQLIQTHDYLCGKLITDYIFINGL